MVFLSLKNSLGAIENPKLFEDLVNMNFYGLFFDVKVIGNDFVRVSERDQLQHFQLTLRESEFMDFFCGKVGLSRPFRMEQRFDLAQD